MASKTVAFELVSPERLLFSQAAEMVVIPGADGDFGVLPGHAPMLSTIRPGVIHVFESRTVSQRLFVSGGFAEVSGARCTVLANDAVSVDDIHKADVERALGEAAEDIAAARDDSERQEAAGRQRIAQAKLTALEVTTYQ